MAKPPFKILSDFDGVWTNQRDEADFILDFAVRELAPLVAEREDSVRARVETYVSRIDAAPSKFGWAPGGRITAYVDEDPLLITNSVIMVLATADDPVAERWREVLEASRFGGLEAFADHCFVGGTKAFRSENPPIMVEAAAEAMAAIRGAGAELVVVSNSRDEKLIAWLEEAGIPAHPADATPVAADSVPVRGDAKKWALSDADASEAPSLELGERRVYLDRPHYRAVIERENPDLIIGDVFSLDLALPSQMRAEGQAAAPGTLILRAHDHTPRWIRDGLAGGRIDGLVSHPRELVGWVERLRAAD